jgi:nicotinamide-nucleotide amidase
LIASGLDASAKAGKMKIAILTIGDELLQGDIPDTNASAIARSLLEKALFVSEFSTVGDHEYRIAEALRRLASNYDTVIVTGGLGPTRDDLTAKAAATAFARPLSLNKMALKGIRERFQTMRRPMTAVNEKQAWLPSRSGVLPNANGTAPGFHMNHQGTDLFFLPGVPREMLAMLDTSVLPKLAHEDGQSATFCQQTITVFGLPEPEVEKRLTDSGLPNDVELAFNVSFPVVIVKLRAKGKAASRRIERAELAVRKALQDFVVGVGEETLTTTTSRLLIASGLTVALAESCTGGLIAKLLTDRPGSSAFLERCVVSYANSAKRLALNVQEDILETFGAVSEECALAMARGVRQQARTEIGLAVTGIAGPDGGTEEKPVGTVCLAMVTSAVEQVERFHFFGDRKQVRLRTACTALDWLRRYAYRQISSEAKEEGPCLPKS